MKKFFIIFGLILSMTSLAYATMFCCPPEKTPGNVVLNEGNSIVKMMVNVGRGAWM